MDEETLAAVSDPPRFGLTRNALKYIAVAAMVIDHSASAFVPGGSWPAVVMHVIGRITGPIMFFAAAEGYHHTKNVNRYMARLAIFAAISYFPFILFLADGTLSNLFYLRFNVLYTILLGVAAIRIRRELINPVIKTLLIVGLFVLSFLGDWGALGLLIMLLFDFYYGNFKNQAFSYCIVVLLNLGAFNTAATLVYNVVYNHYTAFSLYSNMSTVIKTGMFLPIILLRFYNREIGRGGRFSKWFFYVFYPLHLLLLGLARFVV